MKRAATMLLTGATGFVGRALRPALLARGFRVRALSGDPRRVPPPRPEEEWLAGDPADAAFLRDAMDDVDCAYFLPGDVERSAAEAFSGAAAEARVRRIIHLGGIAARGEPSNHAANQLSVGDVLRGGATPTLELRAAMIIGNGGASWQLARDLALRVPALVRAPWMESRMRPIALADIVEALVRAPDVPLERGRWFDLGGPDTLSARQVLERIAALRGRRIPGFAVPAFPMSWARFFAARVSGADPRAVCKLVDALRSDLLPRDDSYFALAGFRPRYDFDRAAARALALEDVELPLARFGAALGEALLDVVGPRR